MLGDVCRALTPGDDERDIARAIMDGARGMRARPIVTLVGSDERLRRYRHPVPTATRVEARRAWSRCAPSATASSCRSRASSPPARPAGSRSAHARDGVASSGALLDATRPGATGAQLYDVAAAGYAAAGFPGEELKHHQGGAIGYRAREWVAHPGSQETVQARQAFAWNPTIAGTKIEDTALVIDERLEMLTTTPDWPQIDVGTSDRAIRRLERMATLNPDARSSRLPADDLNGVYAVPRCRGRRTRGARLNLDAAELGRPAHRGRRHHAVSLRRQRVPLSRHARRVRGARRMAGGLRSAALGRSRASGRRSGARSIRRASSGAMRSARPWCCPAAIRATPRGWRRASARSPTPRACRSSCT